MRRSVWSAVLVLVATAGVAVAAPAPELPPRVAEPAGLPEGFVVTTIASGQSARDLTDFDHLPDGSMITTGKGGKVAWVSATGDRTRELAMLPVTAVQDLGLVGVAAAADYATSGVVYLARALPGEIGSVPLRLSAYTVTGPPAEPTGLGAERTILETTATSDVHTLSGVDVAPDGTLWVSIGDGADFRRVDPGALRTYDINDPRGKVLHLNPDGTGVPGNPFFDPAAPAAVRSTVYATGFRSPFRLTLDPETGLPVLGDVGWDTFEEVNVVRPGASYGWPCFEGTGPTPGYSDLPECATAPDTPPAHLYDRVSGDGSSVTGGIFYTGDQYPEPFRDAYFFGDYTSSRIWTMQFGPDGAVTRPPEAGGFGTGMGGPVGFDTAPGGDIVYADIADGTIKRISYGMGNQAPVAAAAVRNDPQTRTVTFDGGASSDPDGDPLTFAWDFGDGATGAGEVVEHTYADGTPVTATLTVTDPEGATGTDTVEVLPTNVPPTLVLDAPGAQDVFAVGDPVAATATVADPEDGDGPEVTWSTLLVHCPGEVCHDHPGPTSTGNMYAALFTDHGDNTEQRVTATVTDSAGATVSQTFVARPDLRTLTVESTAPVTPTINGALRASAEVTVGSTASVSVPEIADDGTSVFASWSDGLPRAREVVAGTENLTLTATYSSAIDARYATDEVLRGQLGAPAAAETGAGQLRWRDYETGRMYASPAGVYAVIGEIWNRYAALGAHDVLGPPRTDELVAPDGVGHFVQFGTGSIYWTPTTGAWEVRGLIRDRWAALGWEGSYLGYPTGGEYDVPGGRRSDFQGGTITFEFATGAVVDRPL